jgi:hypothetical protein
MENWYGIQIFVNYKFKVKFIFYKMAFSGFLTK